MSCTLNPGRMLSNVRASVPLIQCITNYVTVHDVANIILACGGSPAMVDSEEEAADFLSIAYGLNVNIGTLNKSSAKAIFLAGRRAEELKKPMLLDPVGAGATKYRTKLALSIIDELPVSVVRGNISELMSLYYESGSTRGVDAAAADAVSNVNLHSKVAFAKDAAKRFGCIVAISGAIDLISDGMVCYAVRNGSAKMSTITGTGCQLSGMMTAFIAANNECILEAVLAAACAMGLAGEIAEKKLLPGEGNATYGNRIIDAISLMTEEELNRGARYEVY